MSDTEGVTQEKNTSSFGCLNDGPDWGYLLRIADAAHILEFGNLVLVKPFACGQGCFVAC
jgi:hypothetical protein